MSGCTTGWMEVQWRENIDIAYMDVCMEEVKNQTELSGFSGRTGVRFPIKPTWETIAPPVSPTNIISTPMLMDGAIKKTNEIRKSLN